MLNIVLTGWPSGGKTSVLNSIKERFSELGYNVIVVPETATELINSGIKPFGDNALPPVEFQEIVLRTQLNKEKLAKYAASLMGDNTILIYDRGCLDGYAYVDPETWNQVLQKCNVNYRDLLLNYDAVLYLEGSPKFFTTENNAARYESGADEAREKGEKVLKSYIGHDNLRVIQPREEMKDKQEEVNNIIANMLGNPTRIRNQRKFLVESLDVETLAGVASKVDITQDYLNSSDNYEYRLRCMSQKGSSSYHFAVLKKGENGKREIIKEEIISKKAYEKLLLTKSESIETIRKSRYSFVHNKQYFKLDIFEDGLMMLEVNLTKENPELTIPEFVSVLDDVTNNSEYTNINIARRKKEVYGKGQNNSSRGHRLLREGNAIKNPN
ncbi:MAG: AAA family ATPase [Erysipelotrichales bacterium]|nr:AAA family ATPase [Erysipelotrichales bacterium]